MLALLDSDTGAGAEIVKLLPGEPAVLREAVNGEHHVAVSRDIGVAVVNKTLHDVDDAVDVPGGVRLDVRAEHAEGVKVAVHLLFHACCKRAYRLMVLGGALYDLVIDVGNISDVGYLVAKVAEVADNHVKADEGPPVPDMAVVVDGDAADVHSDFPGLHGFELFLFPCKCIVDSEHD